MKTIQRVIMVDDDPYSHTICKANIRHIEAGVEVMGFILPEKGIEYIECAYSKTWDECPTVLLLDINMPEMNGWEFLERYDKIDSNVKNQFSIYLLSSSIDPGDRQKAADNKNVKGFLMKPFKKVMVAQVLGSSPALAAATRL